MICTYRYCGNETKNGRKLCQAHRLQIWRLQNPLKSSFITLKSNAKRRGIDFKLTLNEWEQFCNSTDYLSLRGIEGHKMTVDRIRGDVGYEFTNIQMLTLSDNLRKRAQDKKFKKKFPKPIKLPDDPF